jgi:molybdate/tungstate transport system substrate-binding protein
MTASRLPRAHRHVRRRALVLLLLTAGCARNEPRPSGDSAQRSHSGGDAGPLVVFNAGSLSPPLRAALDTLAAREHFTVEQEAAGSLESARKLTELQRIPDIIAVADYEVFPSILMPVHATWYARFARNRMVLAYTDRSSGAAEITPENWWRVITRPGVEVGRAEPNVDPAGYRTLMVWQLAERHYKEPGLASRLAENSGPRNVRPKSADLVALLQSNDLDYAWEYESVALQLGLRYVRLPEQIDLGSPADSANYAQAVVRVAGRSRSDTLTLRGQPIVYALSIPKGAPHPELAARVVTWLLAPEGRRILRAKQLDVLDHVTLVGTDVPASVAAKLGGAPPT